MTTTATQIADNNSYKLGQTPIKHSSPLLSEDFSNSIESSADTDEVVLTASPVTEEPPAKKSLKTRFKNFISGFINNLRAAWKKIRVLNPFTHILNLIEHVRCSKHLKAAKDRNGAKTEEELKDYHKSFELNPNNPSEKSLYSTNFQPGNKQKPLVVMFLGNSQTLLTPHQQAGLNELYEKLKRNKNIDLAIFRVGEAGCDIKHKLFMGDCSMHTDVVFENTSNILEDMVKGKGQFAGRNRPSQIMLVGYSFGGGTVDKLLREKWNKIGNGIPTSSICIDPIKLGAYNLGCPVEERPPNTREHRVFYQRNSAAINGCAHKRAKCNDSSTNMINDDHETIDNNPHIHNYILKKVRELSFQTR